MMTLVMIAKAPAQAEDVVESSTKIISHSGRVRREAGRTRGR
jgi:hypothetical protein